MDEVKKERRGGARPGAGRKKMPLALRRLQRRISCTQEELDWLVDQLEARRKKRGEKPRISVHDNQKKRIL